MADKIVDLGGTVVFGETTEFIGAEHILARRGVTPEVGAKIFEKVAAMEARAKSLAAICVKASRHREILPGA